MSVEPAAALAETHISVLVSIGDRVYKLKKPVALGFLDFSDRQLRERACHREVELNRRLAPDVYLGVADVVGVDGEPCDRDLQAEDIFCLDDGPRILDCIEFDDHLRHGDVLADVAFLAMDLERLGAPEAAAEFLARYREFAGESYPQSLAHHYIASRAHVRCKVACLRHGQGDEGAAAAARSLLDLAVRHLEAGRVRLVLVGGLPGTGKSTLAAALADVTGWSVLRSDEVRKDVAGLGHTTAAIADPGEGLYRPELTDATYGALLARARTALELGEAVILDASWSDGRHRKAARDVAEATASDLVELCCVAPPDLAEHRIRSRLAAGGDPSDATPAVAAAMADHFGPWPTASTVDTTGTLDSSVGQALEATSRVSPG